MELTKPVYRDTRGGSSAYRAVLMFRTVILVMAAVLAVAALFPQIDAVTFSIVCLILMVPALLYQIRTDNTLIHTGSVFADDGENLYVVVPVFNFGYGRTHHMKKKVKSNQVSCVLRVQSVHTYPFGIAVRARVLTASSKRAELDMKLLNTPGAMRKALEEKGRRRTVLFRVERSLRPDDEAALVSRLQGLAKSAT